MTIKKKKLPALTSAFLLLPSDFFHQPPHHFLQTIGMGEDVIEAGDFELLLQLGFIEQGDVFLAAVEVQAADGFANLFSMIKQWIGLH